MVHHPFTREILTTRIVVQYISTTRISDLYMTATRISAPFMAYKTNLRLCLHQKAICGTRLFADEVAQPIAIECNGKKRKSMETEDTAVGISFIRIYWGLELIFVSV